MNSLQPSLNERQRDALAALAEVLMPAGDGMPSAKEMDVHREGLNQVLRARPDLAQPLAALLSPPPEATAAAVSRLQSEDPRGFELLTLVIAAAYYMNPVVKRLLGYPGQEARPPMADEAGDYMRDGLLATVVERGPLYRATPGRKANLC